MTIPERLRPHPQDRFRDPAQLFDLKQAAARLRAEPHAAVEGHRQIALFRHGQVTVVLYLFEPEVLKLMPKGRPYDFGHELWPKLLKMKKPIFAYETDSYWCDVGNLPEYRRCQIDVLDRKAKVNIPGVELRKGVWVQEGTVVDPKAKLIPPVVIGKGGRVAGGAVIGPYSVIGDRAQVGVGAKLERCILFDNVTVGDGVSLNNCIIGPNGHVKENISVYEAAVLNIRQ